MLYPASSPVVLTRVRGGDGIAAPRAIHWLRRGDYALDVMANEDCGKQNHKHWKKGNWCELVQVYSKAEAFSVAPIIWHADEEAPVQQGPACEYLLGITTRRCVLIDLHVMCL